VTAERVHVIREHSCAQPHLAVPEAPSAPRQIAEATPERTAAIGKEQVC
jgi:hypothetical protein